MNQIKETGIMSMNQRRKEEAVEMKMSSRTELKARRMLMNRLWKKAEEERKRLNQRRKAKVWRKKMQGREART